MPCAPPPPRLLHRRHGKALRCWSARRAGAIRRGCDYPRQRVPASAPAEHDWNEESGAVSLLRLAGNWPPWVALGCGADRLGRMFNGHTLAIPRRVSARNAPRDPSAPLGLKNRFHERVAQRALIRLRTPAPSPSSLLGASRTSHSRSIRAQDLDLPLPRPAFSSSSLFRLLGCIIRRFSKAGLVGWFRRDVLLSYDNAPPPGNDRRRCCAVGNGDCRPAINALRRCAGCSICSTRLPITFARSAPKFQRLCAIEAILPALWFQGVHPILLQLHPAFWLWQ